MKKTLLILFLIASKAIFAGQTQTIIATNVISTNVSTSTISANKMTFPFGYTVGGTPDSTGALFSDSTFLSSLGTWATMMYTERANYFANLRTGAQVISALGYTPLNPNGTSGQYIKGNGTFGTLPGNYVPAINPVTRSIASSNYTISTTLQAFVNYTIQISCTATIGGAASGSVVLQYSTNSGSTWTTIQTVANSNTVTLALTLNAVTIQTASLSGYIPANALVRMVGASSGTTAITYLSGFETY